MKHRPPIVFPIWTPLVYCYVKTDDRERQVPGTMPPPEVPLRRHPVRHGRALLGHRDLRVRGKHPVRVQLLRGWNVRHLLTAR